MSEQERMSGNEETEKIRRDEEADVEGHKIRRSDDDAEHIRRSDDEGPDVEGHKFR
jgi:hypothetical protein